MFSVGGPGRSAPIFASPLHSQSPLSYLRHTRKSRTHRSQAESNRDADLGTNKTTHHNTDNSGCVDRDELQAMLLEIKGPEALEDAEGMAETMALFHEAEVDGEASADCDCLGDTHCVGVAGV